MKYLVCILSTFLTGCVYQSINSIDIQKAVLFCGSTPSIEYIRAYSDGNEFVKCTNQTKSHSLENVLLP